MKDKIQLKIREVFDRFGLLVRKKSRLGGDPFLDMGRLAGDRPVVFDVGANVGQSLEQFQKYCASPTIHAFEPSDKAFAELAAAHGASPNVKLNHCGLAARRARLDLVENRISRMSSFLELGRDGFGEVVGRSSIEIRTLDEYCVEHNIPSIDILKIDTQGFDLEVLKGAQRMLLAHRIKYLLVEITFVQMYQGAPRCDEVLRAIYDSGFETVALYEVFYRDERAGEVDMLFLDRQFGKW